MKRVLNFLGCLAIATAFLLGWGGSGLVALAAPGDTAEAVIHSTDSEQVAMGIAELTETNDGLVIQADFIAAPAGLHGFHVHAEGSCADGGQAAGGHYNPADVPHGYLPEDGFDAAHAGDLGNVEISEDGTGLYALSMPGLSLRGGSYPVADHAFILHADADDFGQPTGNAGGRIGCGVIELN